ncbi:uncharacterized protein At4g06744-like [Wolffia australiana]
MAAAAAAAASALILFFFSAAATAPQPGCGYPAPMAGCNRPPAVPPAAPPLKSFENARQFQAFIVIQRFKATITCDPLGVTQTWNGPRVCDYTGFACATPPNTTDRTIYGVDFNGFRLAAPTLVGFPDQLPDLSFFHANSNNFAGTVPDLTALAFLFELDLSNNRLSGPVPAHVARLTQVVFFDLRYNQFQGALQGGVFGLDLDFLFLNNNPFNARLPENVGDTRAAFLTLANNGFSGSIPAGIGRAAETLREVLFLNNRLTGCLPVEVGMLGKATVFDAGDNQISGTIPKSFGCLRRVEQLNLARNRLYGAVPETVCELPRLLNLSLSGNFFTEIGPSCVALLKRGLLDVRGNCLPAMPWLPAQRPPAECAKFLAAPPCCPVDDTIPCAAPPHRPGACADAPAPSPSKAYSAALHKGRVR